MPVRGVRRGSIRNAPPASPIGERSEVPESIQMRAGCSQARKRAGLPERCGKVWYRRAAFRLLSTTPSALLHRNVGFLDDVAPERGLLGEEFGRIGGRTDHRLKPQLAQSFGHIWALQDLDHIAVDLAGERLR